MRKILCLMTLMLVIFAAHAQTGAIIGKVQDEKTSFALKSATITLVNDQGSPTGRKGKTDGSGNYRIENLTPGNYTIEFSCKGYSKQTIKGILVSDGKATAQNIELTPTGR